VLIRVARNVANRLSVPRPIGASHSLPYPTCVSSSAMDSFETNKILGALLFTCLLLVAVNIAAGAIFTPPKPAKPGYDIAVQEHPSEAKAAAPAPGTGQQCRAGSNDLRRAPL